MKKTVVWLVMLACAGLAFAQTPQQQAQSEGLRLAIKRDFPELVIREQTVIPMNFKSNADASFRVVPSYLDRSKVEEEGYQVLIQGEKRTVSANYNKDYILLSAIIHRKNVTPKPEVRHALVAAYPGWTIAKNSYRMLRNEKGNIKEVYKHILTKGSTTITVRTDGHGRLLKKSQEAKI